MQKTSAYVTGMQKCNDNCTVTYIQPRASMQRAMQQSELNSVALGPNTSAVDGVDAVESIPSHDLLSLCTPTKALYSA